jgi:hypothetical protein
MLNLTKPAALAAMVVGIAAGSYGVASAASGSGSTTTTTTPTLPTAPTAQQGPWGPQRSDETPLTGEALAKVTAAAQAKEPGATIVRVETDADGHAAYEAHMTRADGTPVTVYVNTSYDVVGDETR